MALEWTEDRVRHFRKAWFTSMTTTEIGEMFGISKSAVAGKAHRLKLPVRSDTAFRGGRPPKDDGTTRKTRKNSQPPLSPARLPRPKPQPPTFLPPPRQCAWPIGEPKKPGFHFCGEPTVPGKPYCQPHCDKAFTKATR
jgi:GcrA cell cycle regulator